MTLALDPSIAVALLYAETHFRFFRFFPNLLFRKFPEVIFDAPRRVGPRCDLPVLLLLSDLVNFPAQCLSVSVSISQPGNSPRLFTFDNIEPCTVVHPFSRQSSAYVFRISRQALGSGAILINCTATIKRGRKTRTILNDNLIGSSKFPFSCFLAEEPLPGSAMSSLGDVHVHSHYSQSHVEFGPPLIVIDEFSKCYGNDFVAITDHSYDLACSMDNYLKADPHIERWKSLHEEADNNDLKNIIVLGEEVSCLNSKGKVIHLCALGLKNYLPGTLDGGRPVRVGAIQLSLTEAITQSHEQQGVTFAAHPGSTMGFMQRFFLKRGNWEQKDYHTSLNGIQGINNGFGKTWRRAKSMWIKELLKEHKLTLVAGNDSHGDFNRYRYLSIPFVSIGESFTRHFSYAMTGIYGKTSSKQDVIQALKQGKTYVTTGPFLCMGFGDSPMESIISQEDITLSGRIIVVSLISTKEFGNPWCIRLYCGDLQAHKETCIFQKFFEVDQYAVCEKIMPLGQVQRGYLRAEAECKKTDGAIAYCATSPCYFFK